MEEFRKDARNVKLRIGDHFIEDVTDVLKRFFREVDDPIFMADLHPLWQAAASESMSPWTRLKVVRVQSSVLRAGHVSCYTAPVHRMSRVNQCRCSGVRSLDLVNYFLIIITIQYKTISSEIRSVQVKQ